MERVHDAQANRARQGDEGVTRFYASLEDETLRFYGGAGARARALRALSRRPFLEGRAALQVIAGAQRQAEQSHYGQRQALFELDMVVEKQRKAMLTAYEAVLRHAAPHGAVRAFLPDVAAGEIARRPANAIVQDMARRLLATALVEPDRA